MRGKALTACICNGSGREIPDLLQQKENNRAQHNECNEFHGDSPFAPGWRDAKNGAGLLRCNYIAAVLR